MREACTFCLYLQHIDCSHEIVSKIVTQPSVCAPLHNQGTSLYYHSVLPLCTTSLYTRNSTHPLGNCGNGDMGIPMGTDPFFQHPAFETLIMDNSISGRREAVIDAECYSASTLLWNPAWDWPQMLADGVGMCKYVGVLGGGACFLCHTCVWMHKTACHSLVSPPCTHRTYRFRCVVWLYVVVPPVYMYISWHVCTTP